MFNRKNIVIFFSVILLSTPMSCIAANNSPSDVIELRTSEYKEHTKGLVLFTHEKHISDYNIECGNCHHDNKGTPLNNLKKGDAVDRCISCHKETDNKPKEEKLTKGEWINKYHKKAIHTNCKSCHKNSNKEKGLNKNDAGAAPESCKGCHLPKK